MKFNNISCLEVDGVVVEDLADFSAKIVSFYTFLYEELFSWRPSLDGLEFDTILDWSPELPGEGTLHHKELKKETTS